MKNMLTNGISQDTEKWDDILENFGHEMFSHAVP